MIQTRKRFSFKQAFIFIFSIGIMSYLVYHVFQGERGLISYLRLQQKLTLNEKELKDAQEQRELLERRVYLLRPDSLDIDMLEERARTVLNFAHSDDIVLHDGAVGVPAKE